MIDKEGKMVYETLRLFIKPIWNAYHIFTLYANADRIRGENLLAAVSNLNHSVLDRYILAKLKMAVSGIAQGLDNFNTQIAYSNIANFFEVLNNWYIRRNRHRFWKSKKDSDKAMAYNMLYTCLQMMCQAMSSLAPLIAEDIYLGLTGANNSGGSVHLTNFPDLNAIEVDQT